MVFRPDRGDVRTCQLFSVVPVPVKPPAVAASIVAILTARAPRQISRHIIVPGPVQMAHLMRRGWPFAVECTTDQNRDPETLAATRAAEQ
jgi:hypothetical protein